MVSGQLTEAFKAKDPQMNSYCDKAKSFMTQFKELKIHAIIRELNSQADALAKGVAYGEYSNKNELVLKKDAIEEEEEEEEKLCEVNMIDVS